MDYTPFDSQVENMRYQAGELLALDEYGDPREYGVDLDCVLQPLDRVLSQPE